MAGEAGGELCVVISFYDRRPREKLLDLLASMARHDAGIDFAVRVVVNQTLEDDLALPEAPFPVTIISRENLGMNLGAWDRAWREAPRHGAYLFLQDECLVVRENWGAAFVQRCSDPGVGLVGETFNTSWDHSWDRLRALHRGSKLADHFVDGHPAGRVDAYLDAMKRWGIDPGVGGAHLRSLTLAARRETLELIDGFPIGANYGECIAAEIAVSRKCVAAGLRLVQMREAQFSFVQHREWTQEAPGGAFHHSRKDMPEARWDVADRAILDEEAARVSAILDCLPRPQNDFDNALIVASLACKLADREAELIALKAQLDQSAKARK